MSYSSAIVHEHPYASFIHRIDKPVRYLGGEHGAVRKPWDSVRARVVLAFPDLYDIGMSHLGFKILYGILNKHPDTLAERAYAPWADMERELRERKLPLVTLESARPLCDFDVVGFSLQFELTYSNVLLMLDLGGIPLRAADRTEAHPLVLAGGPTATHGEPLAPFIDAFVIGDGEKVSVEIALAWAALRDANVPRADRLRAIAKIQGVYVPSLYDTTVCPKSGLEVIAGPRVPEAPRTITRAFIPDLDAFPFPSDGPVAATETVFDRISVEIARGCTEGCRFCQAGMIYRPVRERAPETVVDTIVNAVKRGGYDEASLTSLSTADYSAIAPLVKTVMQRLEKEKVSLSVSSLRAYGLTEDLLDEIQKVRATGLTFAPEAGTQRMRDVVNKNVTDAQLMETAERVFTRGWSKMKLYFMIGLPTEQDEDVLGIVETGKRARDVGRRVQRGRGPNVTVSVSTHVPKPHTPFQWCAMDTLADIKRKQSMLRDQARAMHVELRLHESNGSILEGVLARGDRRLADVIEHAYRRGARFDSWEERLNLAAWDEAFTHFAVERAKYLGTIPVDARLPWDHIDMGLEDGFLLREYRRSVANRLSPPCGKAVGQFVHHTNLEDARADARKLLCYDCGVACDLTQMRQERLVSLTTLGAERRREPAAETEVAAPRDERRPRAQFAQGEPQRYRIAFARVGRAAFQSHLDLIRVVPRVFRRAEIPMYYSQGFHPKPEMMFGPALGLGISTLDEYVDVKLAMNADPETLCASLQPGAPEGLVFVKALRLGPNDPAVSKIVDTTEYVAAVPWSALRERGLGDVAAVQAAIDAKREGDLSVRRNVEGIGKKIDVKSYLVRIAAGEGQDALDRAGFAGELLPVRFATRVTSGGACKPSEVFAALFDEHLPVRFVRTAQGRTLPEGGLVTPMELPRLEVVRPVKAPRVEATAVEAAPQGEALAPSGPSTPHPE